MKRHDGRARRENWNLKKPEEIEIDEFIKHDENAY
jgi:hypothetical protein